MHKGQSHQVANQTYKAANQQITEGEQLAVLVLVVEDDEGNQE